MMPRELSSSFSSSRPWSVGLNLALAITAAAAIVAMINHLAARHYKRFAWSVAAQTELSDITKRVLETITNQVSVTIFYDREEPTYDAVSDLLDQYQFFNPRIQVTTLDYLGDPARAKLVKARYKLSDMADNDLVIFECNGRTKMVYQGELSELDVQPLVSGQSREVKRVAFKGEMMFTSALLNVTSLRVLKAYFLEGHREHSPKDDGANGYSNFAALLKANNIEWSELSLIGTNDVPADCNMLILAGPTTAMTTDELEKIGKYLDGGGRMLTLFSFYGLGKNTGLRELLARFGVRVGNDLVQDAPNSTSGQEIQLASYGVHPITKPLINSRLLLLLPRSIMKGGPVSGATILPEVSELFFTGPKGTIVTDIRDGVPYAHPATDVQTNVCLAVAVEKGKIRDVMADRGTTRVVVVGDSFFLDNQLIDFSANRDFAALSINWLLDRTELLAGLGPQPIREFKLTITQSHMTGLLFLLLVGMPGLVLLVGTLVWTRRRR